MALDAYSNTKWTSTRVAPTRNAPFAGFEAAEAASPWSGAFSGAQGGVVLVLLGLGAVLLFSRKE